MRCALDQRNAYLSRKRSVGCSDCDVANTDRQQEAALVNRREQRSCNRPVNASRDDLRAAITEVASQCELMA